MPATVSHTTQTFPFGEEMAAQHAGGAYATRYKFNGKELDPQTGYYYYGARYYDPVITRWLSVDPLAEKYPGLSPYNYTANNPVMLVDPDGKKIGKGKEIYNKFRKFIENQIKKYYVLNALSSLSSLYPYVYNKKEKRNISKEFCRLSRKLAGYKETLNELNVLRDSDVTYNILINDDILPRNAGGAIYYNTKSHQIEIFLISDYEQSYVAHELKHAYQYEMGMFSFTPNGQRGGLLYDLQDELEAFDRGHLFGGEKKTLSQLQSLESYAGIRDRTTQRTLSSLMENGNSFHGYFKNHAAKQSMPLNLYHGWQQDYISPRIEPVLNYLFH